MKTRSLVKESERNRDGKINGKLWLAASTNTTVSWDSSLHDSQLIISLNIVSNKP